MDFIPRALIFDMDGVLFDSEPLHQMAWAEAIAPYGVQLGDEVYHRHRGRPDRALADELHERWNPSIDPDRILDEKRVHYARLLDSELIVFENVPAKIQQLYEKGLPMALCTSCIRAEAEPALEVAGILRFMRTLVTIDQVERPKPDPQPYELACARLGFDPSQCLVLEDSPTGSSAARAAGCHVGGILSGHTPGELPAAHRHFAQTQQALDWVMEVIETSCWA